MHVLILYAHTGLQIPAQSYSDSKNSTRSVTVANSGFAVKACAKSLNSALAVAGGVVKHSL